VGKPRQQNIACCSAGVYLFTMNKNSRMEAWYRLAQGKPVDDLKLDFRGGRIDLSGLRVAEPTPGKRFLIQIAGLTEEVTLLKDLTLVRGVNWSGLDFSRARLDYVRIIDSSIQDCVFDQCSFKDGGLWGTTISNSSFRGADLRGSALGPLEKRRRNVFREVDFTETDLRQTAYTSAEFVRCLFKNANLTKVDFEGSAFTDCVFEGELREVVFNRHGFEAEDLPPNKMEGVDFSLARLRYVEFRGLDLDKVRFPEDEDHIVIDDYPGTLDRILAVLRGRTDTDSRVLAAGVAVERKWLSPNRKRGVLNKKDILEAGGEEGLKTVLQALETSGN
jgi:uncharacterized protein YjbI with pentapeptide repeats